MTDVNLYSNIESSTDVYADFRDSIVVFYDDIINKGGITDQRVINALAQLRAKTDITLKELG